MKRRQMLIPEIASEYRMLIDESEDRVHVNVTVAREPAEPEKDALANASCRGCSASGSCRTSRSTRRFWVA